MPSVVSIIGLNKSIFRCNFAFSLCRRIHNTMRQINIPPTTIPIKMTRFQINSPISYIVLFYCNPKWVVYIKIPNNKYFLVFFCIGDYYNPPLFFSLPSTKSRTSIEMVSAALIFLSNPVLFRNILCFFPNIVSPFCRQP